jgi:hypothetical protein
VFEFWRAYIFADLARKDLPGEGLVRARLAGHALQRQALRDAAVLASHMQVVARHKTRR